MSFTEQPSAAADAASSSIMASALASMSEMTPKAIFNSISNSSASLAEKTNERTGLFRGLSITKPKTPSVSSTSSLQHTEGDQSKQSTNSLFTDSLAAASSVFSNLKNSLDSPPSENSDTAKPKPGKKRDQKQKQNLFFRKIEAHSLSLSSAVFGNILDIDSEEKSSQHVNMLEHNATRANSESGNSPLLAGHASNGSIKRKIKPPGTLEYNVEPNDTIEKIALKWNTVPSEIQHLNRLATRVIFPGQVIFVPDPNYIPPPPPSSPPVSPHTKAQLPEAILNELHTLEEKSNSTSLPAQSGQANNTSNNNNNNSSGFKIFKWKSSQIPKPGHVEPQKQKASSLSELSLNSSSSEEKKSNPLISRHTLTEEDAKKLDEECMQRFLKVNCKIVTRSKGCFDGVLIITPSAIMFDPFDNSNKNNSSRRDSFSNSSNIYDEASAIIPIEIISNVIMYEDLALKDVQEYFDYQNHIDQIEDENSKPAEVCFGLNEGQNSFQESEKSDKDDVFVENGKNGQTRNRTESNSTSSNSSLISCYLCIKVNKNKDFISCPLNRKMKNRLSSEFWFQINDNSTDKICAFFLEWKSDPTFSITEDNMPKGQFQLVKHDEKLADAILENLMPNSSTNQLSKAFSSTNRLINKGIASFIKDWEIVNLKELELKIKQEIEIEKEYKTLPKLNDPSSILKEEHLRKLNINLIPRAVGYNWVLSFSTELHGFSLNTMYRLLAEIETPCLIVVQDSNRNIFGAMSSCKLYQSEHFYGTGESFLYTFYPSFKIYKWTGENNFFIRGNAEGLGFGCAEGYHGLWFDGDLLNGHTQRSKTFDNDMLSSTEYFTITALEVWTFSD